MIYELVPTELHSQLNAFRHDLEQITLQKIQACPFCEKDEFYLIRSRPTSTYRCKFCHKYFTVATNTPFNRLTPFYWLATIFTGRVQNESYHDIAESLDCTLEKVMRRDHALADYLKEHYQSLYEWYKDHQKTEMTPTIAEQHKIVSEKITALLHAEKPSCLHCNSTETTKVGTRTCYRCKRCRHSFNILSNTPLNRLPRTELWQEFVDLLVAGQNNMQIEKALKLNGNTVSKWRKSWCGMMRTWNCEALAIWCSRH